MKIDEAVSRIESTSKSICAWKNGNYIHVGFNTFTILVIPDDAKTFFDVHFINPNLELPANLKMQLDGIVGKFLRTPVKERFPEKKYRLRWINDQGRCKNYLNLNSNGAWVFVDDEIDADTFTESGLEQLKKDNPRFAPAIDAMKEEAKGNED